MSNPQEFLKFINSRRTLPLQLDRSLDDYFVKAQQSNQSLPSLYIDTSEIIRLIEYQGKQIQFTFEVVHFDQIGPQFVNQEASIYSGILEILKKKDICFDNTYTCCYICPLKSMVQYSILIVLQRKHVIIDSIIQQQNYLQIQGWINNKSFCQGQLLQGEDYFEFDEEDCRFKAIPNLELKLFEIRLYNKNTKILPVGRGNYQIELFSRTEKIYEQGINIQHSNLNDRVDDQKYLIEQLDSLFRSCLEDNQPRNSLQRKLFNEDNDVFDKFTQNLQQKYLKDPRPISNIDGLISNKSNLMDSTINPIESIYFVDDSNCSFLKQTQSVEHKPINRELFSDKPKTPCKWNQQQYGNQELVKSKVQISESFGYQQTRQRDRLDESRINYQDQQSPYFTRHQDIQDSIRQQHSNRFQQETPINQSQITIQQQMMYKQQQEQIQNAQQQGYMQQAIYQTPTQTNYQQQLNSNFSQVQHTQPQYTQPQLSQIQNNGNGFVINNEAEYLLYQQYQNQLQAQQQLQQQQQQYLQQQYELHQNQLMQYYNQQQNNYQQLQPQLQDFTQLIKNQQDQIVQLQQYVQQQESVLYPNMQQVQQLQSQIITLQQQLIQMQQQQTLNNQYVQQTPQSVNYMVQSGKENQGQSIQSIQLQSSRVVEQNKQQAPAILNSSQLNSIRLSWNEADSEIQSQNLKQSKAKQINSSNQKTFNPYHKFNAVYHYVHSKKKDQDLIQYLFRRYKFIKDQHYMMQDESSIRDNGQYDFNLKINGQDYKCHKKILKTQSQLLAQYIDEGKSQIEFSTPIDHPNSIKHTIRYLYTGCYLSDSEVLTYKETKSLYLLAQKLQLNNLLEATIFHGVIKKITQKNVVKWFKVANQNKKSNSDIYLFLKEYCIDYFSIHIKSILQNISNNEKLSNLLDTLILEDLSCLLSKSVLVSHHADVLGLFLKINNQSIIECVANLSKKYEHLQGFTYTKIEQNYNVSDQIAIYENNVDSQRINLVNKNYDYGFNSTNLVFEVQIEDVKSNKIVVCPQFYSTSQKWQMMIEISENAQISIYFQQIGLIDELQKDYQSNEHKCHFTSSIIKLEVYSNNDLLTKQSFFHSFPNGQKYHVGQSDICKVWLSDIKVRVFIEEVPIFSNLLEQITKNFDPQYAKTIPTFVLFSILSSDHLTLHQEEDLYRVFLHKELTSSNEILIYALRTHELKSLNTYNQLDLKQLELIFSQLTKYGKKNPRLFTIISSNPRFQDFINIFRRSSLI